MPDLDIIGIGSPLIDLLVEVDDDFLATHVSGAKGGMEIVELDVIHDLLTRHGGRVERAPGGAASNTTVGCAALGLKAAFIGSSGADDGAEFYAQSLKQQQCEPRLIEHPEAPTGHVLSMITPDAERTMRTCLGAAALLDPALVVPELFADARLVMLEGYTLFNPDLTRAVARAAKEAGCELALDMASFEVVQAGREVLEELLDGQVDLAFANADEAAAWHPDGWEAALEDLAGRCKVAVVKLGKEGAHIRQGDDHRLVPADLVEAVDTTGAGDTWASGFLAGYLRGHDLERCGRLAAQAGKAVVQVVGAQVPAGEWQRMRGWLEAWE